MPPSRRAARRLVGLAVSTVVAAQIAGCASDRDPPPSDAQAVLGAPVADTFAFDVAGGQLDDARFDRLMDRGPDEVALSRAVGGEPVTGDDPEAPDAIVHADEWLDVAPPPPTLKPPPMPVGRTTLPDGRIRLIWHLQGGGARGMTATGNGSGRRGVEVRTVDTAPIVALVAAQFGDAASAVPLPEDNRLVIVCQADAEADVIALLQDVDQPGRQVEIKARIFEVNHGFDYQQGFRLLAQRIAEDGTQTALSTFRTAELLESAAGQPFQGSIISVMQVLQDVGISLDASFELLAETGLINVVSEPRLTVAEGDTGYLLAGQEIPIQSADIVKGVLQAKTQYKPVGVQLYVTPQVVGDGHVRLHALSVVSSVAGFTPLPTLRTGGDSTAAAALLVNPVIDAREAETNVTVGDGETLVISGLRMVRTTTREDKVPGLGDIPILGHLFKNHRTQRRMTDLYFFLTPTVIDTDAVASAW